MDPLTNVYPELHEFVIQHFNAADFREATEVSPNWKKTIEKSRGMMKKVKLELRSITDMGRFKGTTRCYENVAIVDKNSKSYT